MTTITLGTGLVPARNFYRLQLMQRHILLDEWTWDGLYDFTTVRNVWIGPTEILVKKNRPYIFISFDYEPQRTGMEVVRIPDRYVTTHFHERISLN